ncbi:MAG TPA: glucose-1-phosphate cytidylyltransferase [Ferruginibacter sp.]|nr:glucose-1-phosphate cytidylyltransferase [Ferruginibacter sp.]
MKVVILAGGLGTRLSEETDIKPKPMVEIGGKPILWHIMKIYSSFGFNEFIVCLGYKGYIIKEYFANYFLHQSDVAIDLSNNQLEILNSTSENWKITLVDTGINTMTGGRIKRIQKYVNNEPFMLTYGDGVSNVSIDELIKFHKANKRQVTLTAISPQSRFGVLNITGEALVSSFEEKPKGDDSWINGGFFVCEPGIFDKIQGDLDVWEHHVLANLAKENQLAAYRHNGFWRPMDTLRDKIELNALWENNKADWKLWK